jgi:hypothetical protein
MGNAQYTMEDVFKDTLEENNMSAEMCWLKRYELPLYIY